MNAAILHNNGKGRLTVDRRRLIPNLGPVYCRLVERQIVDATAHGFVAQDEGPDLDVVLCSTRSAKQYTEGILDRLGTRYTVLGRQLERWRHVDKIRLVLDHIERHPSPEFLLHVDATDVLVLEKTRGILGAFRRSFSCGILFGAEKGSAPGAATAPGIADEERRFIGRIERFERSNYPAPFCHLNAGCFIGRKQAITAHFRAALRARKSWPIHSILPNGNVLADDDQLILRELHRTCHPDIQIDHECRIFQNLFAIRRTELAVPIDATVPAFTAALLGHLGELMKDRARRVVQAWRSKREQ